MTLDEAYEYVDQAHEMEGEQRAEFGMGAVSMGYDGNEAMAFYEGYRTADDPQYAEAQRIIANAKAQTQTEWTVIPRAIEYGDDIPF